MSLTAVLLILLILAIFAAAPVWSYSRGWGYVPSVGLLAVIIVLLLVTNGI